MIHVVWTVGHGDRSFADMEHLLADHDVATLVDVRSQPYSRRAPDFVRSALDEYCRDASIHYRWMGASLGGRPTDPALMLADGAPNLEAIARSPGFQGGIEELAAVARASTTVIMCAESDPSLCHRSTLIAPAIEERGFEVVHLLADGTWMRHQSTLPL